MPAQPLGLDRERDAVVRLGRLLGEPCPQKLGNRSRRLWVDRQITPERLAGGVGDQIVEIVGSEGAKPEPFGFDRWDSRGRWAEAGVTAEPFKQSMESNLQA